MKVIIEKAKESFLRSLNDFGSDPYHLLSHVDEMEKWARYMLKRYPEADEEIVLLAVWLHDIGHYPIPAEIDHAIRSQERAKDFLEKEKYPKGRINKVLHGIRAHRNKDVMPKSFEAKIIAFIDSASHITTPVYFDMAKEDKENKKEFTAYAKIQRDIRDLHWFPEVQEELKELAAAWTNLLKAYEKINLD